LTEIVERIRSLLLDELRPIFAGAREWDLTDFPHHFNCGDSAIWLGCLAVANELGIRVRSTTSSRTYRRDKLTANGPIVLNGGGNLGGLYPVHDDLRVRILTDFPDRQIVQMPQSIEVTDARVLNRLKRAIASHPDFTLLVRDHRSLAIAQREFECRTVLVPDAAFALGRLDRLAPLEDVVLQARRDGEAAAERDPGRPTVDWNTARILSLRNLGRSAVSVADALPSPALSAAVANGFARQNLRWGIRTLSRGRVLVTDRLHGHVIATLCGIEHIVVNDRNGKVRALWEAWTSDAPMARFVPTWRDAEAALDDLVNGRHVS
jgi:exopolysaccharide biosynthesis predicted pyruvyltransferase EpsI